METYEKKYKELEGKIKKAYLYAQTDSTKAVLEEILPELAESEDEKIRKELKRAIAVALDYSYFDKETADNILAWLEKQKSVEEIVERCKKSWYNEGKVQGMREGLSDDEKYQQGWHDELEKQNEQNPAWSEEDKNFMYDTLSNLTELKDRYGEGYGNVGKCIEWLKSIKERVQPQPKQEWSEDDERIALGIEQLCNCASLLNISPVKINKVRQWLKSLKDRVQSQKQWKPSDAQTKALEHFVRSIGESGYASPYDANLKLVHSLLNDLKKLKGK